MCGIFGTRSNGSALQQAIQGLNDLSYRGYDSWGVAFLGDNGAAYRKEIGLVPKPSEIDFSVPQGSSVIGHTRWSTHGAPTKENAHPHLSYDGRFAVVHNGIIENYLHIKESLPSVAFQSDTDSEVIAHFLAEKVASGLDIQEAIRSTSTLFRGRFAFVVLDSKDNSLYALRCGSPVVISENDQGCQYISSDINALSAHTSRFVPLEDLQMASLSDAHGIVIEAVNTGEQVPLVYEEVEHTENGASKGKYSHFMRKEIDEQVELLKNNVLDQNRDAIEATDFLEITRIVIIACGTSWHAGLVAEYWIEQLAGLPVEVEYASEFRYRSAPIGKSDCLIAISQSGETADTNAAAELAKASGALLLAICNVQHSTLSRMADNTLFTNAGPEIGVASTKAFTTQLAVLYELALSLAVSRETLSSEEVALKRKAMLGLPEKISWALGQEAQVRSVAKKIRHCQHALFLGRGLHFPIALEAALKLKEVSYIHAEGYPAAEMKHGPIALIEPGLPVFFVATKDACYEKIRSNIAEVKARGAYVIAIGTEGDTCLEQHVDDVLWLPSIASDLMPILSVIPFQLLSYHAADFRGCDIDKPRNLAKSVTVE